MVQSLLYLLSLMVEETWLEALNGELQKPYALTLSKFVQTEIFNALNSTPFSTLKVVILGQGVLLLNAVLTVRKHQANSHAKKGWEQFTDTVIKTISQKKEGVVLIDATKHHILQAAHPSGLSANRGFFGCRHFSLTNQLLELNGIGPIDWQL
ncbi:hypothetical protein Lal_00019496 [Lupinus albus]|nr:hypothetical protein Lal_00019496 [Lupinus albus]